jgi:preprotein translocase subunit SecA
MVLKLLRKIVGTKNSRELKRMGRIVARINALEPQISALDDESLRALTPRFRERLAAGEALDQLLPEAFAAVREASRRALGMRHFDMQLIGGITLHEGRIAEMRTGEGKTLVATLPVYLNALTGRGVHVVTVNDYLARRDAAWMEPIYRFLGMSVGTILPNQDIESKRSGYAADITYGTNNEFGFDYLRDNMVFSLDDKMQRDLHFAIVDEVDSILIDEARTPLIISGAAEDSSRLYKRMNALVPRMKAAAEDGEGHFVIDEKTRQVELTEEGHLFIEQMLISEGLLPEGESLYHAINLGLLHHVHTALRAHHLYHRDVEYIVQNAQLVLIDEHTGRTMPGRRLSEGLHQALEAKEGVAIQAESHTLASTTFQNYFRLYDKLGGMTGTADTEAYEFRQIYGLDVVVIPTNKPCVRHDLNDLVYLTKEEKFEAVVADVSACIEKGAPVLVGTASIETSEELSAFLRKQNIPHQVLNAKFHEREAEIIAQAGRPGSVTIATNMAGRGTDIVLGGNLEAELAQLENPDEARIAALRQEWELRHARVIEAGGLHIIGTERHESRRIDNQLRGRAGRQGDPGLSRFYLSLEDSLMRIFASDRVKNFMQVLGMQRGEAIEHRMVSNAIEKAQRKVEGRNFDIRKQLLEYDDVANDQRRVIYQQRNDLLESVDISESISQIRADVVNGVVSGFIPPQSLEEQWNVAGLEQHLKAEYGVALPLAEWLEKESGLEEQALRARIVAAVADDYALRVAPLGVEIHKLERHIMLQVLDTLWKDHLAAMDALRQGIGLRAYANRNPKQEYKREAFKLFEELLENVKYEVVRFLSRVQVRNEEEIEAFERQQREQQEREQQNARFLHAAAPALGADTPAPGDAGTSPQPEPVAPFVREERKVGRNEPCPCGSGKKYKQCHGQIN